MCNRKPHRMYPHSSHTKQQLKPNGPFQRMRNSGVHWAIDSIFNLLQYTSTTNSPSATFIFASKPDVIYLKVRVGLRWPISIQNLVFTTSHTQFIDLNTCFAKYQTNELHWSGNVENLGANNTRFHCGDKLFILFTNIIWPFNNNFIPQGFGCGFWGWGHGVGVLGFRVWLLGRTFAHLL